MKYLNYIFIACVTISLVGAVFAFFVGTSRIPAPVACTMDAKICPDGSAVGRVGPHCEFAPCPTADVLPEQGNVQTDVELHKDLIVLDTPTQGAEVTSPITITGKARGTWYFEASFPIVIVDWDGRIIGEGHAEAQNDWMTEDFVPFAATVSFDLPADAPYMRGAIILKKDNPSGLPEHDDALEIPVTFGIPTPAKNPSYTPALDLSKKGLREVPTDTFNQTSLASLDLSNNNLTSVQAEIRHLSNLRSLNLSHNTLTNIPAELGQLSKLEILDLSYNKLTGLPYELGNLSNLKTLDLRGNAYAKQDLEIIKQSLPATTRILTD